MKLSKTKISKKTKRKTKPELVETIELAKKNNLLKLANKLSGPTRLQKKMDLEYLNKLKAKKIMVIGKILGKGDMKRKISVSALGFSESALKKLKKSGCEANTIKQEIEKNKKLEEVEII